MCGIAGIVAFDKCSGEMDIKKMLSTLVHRGPDDEGFINISTNNASILFGQRRLSIIDLSSGGHQPMSFGNCDIILNGEIYNFKEIRDELLSEGFSFTSNSDTEVVLKSYLKWGTGCVDKFIGMFAFAICDRNVNKILFCRDRLGVKPLFFFKKENIFLFGSELKALMAHNRFEKILNKNAVSSFLQFGYIPGPESIFENTFKLDQASWLVLDLCTEQLEIIKYWDIQANFNQSNPEISYEEALIKSEELLISACKYRMVSDVPVGVFLSGGYDSTLVASILVNSGFKNLKTFTIGFPDGKDESSDATKISDFLSTVHTTYNCTLDEAKKIIPELPYYYDEPCGDISCIPTILVSRLASAKVKVVLSADGGDELFAGYDGYYQTIHRFIKLKKIPFVLKKTFYPFLTYLSKLFPFWSPYRHKLSEISKIFKDNKFNVSEFVLNSSKVPDSIISSIFLSNIQDTKKYISNIDDLGNNILLSNFENSLVDYLLVKVDRATMSASIEGREPLLDHRLVELTARLPFEFKNDGVRSKKIIKDIVHKYIPSEIMERPKTGFDLPIYDWLKSDMSWLIDKYLNKTTLEKSELINSVQVIKLVELFKADKLVYKSVIWNLIVFQMWFEKWVK